MNKFAAANLKSATIPADHIYAGENGLLVATVIDDGKMFYAVFEDEKTAFESWVKSNFTDADGECFAKIEYKNA